MEAAKVGAQRVGQDEGIAGVVLGASREVAVAEAVQLLGVEREDVEAMLGESFDDSPTRYLDGCGQSVRSVAGFFSQPLGHVGQATAAVLRPALAEDGAAAIHQADAVLFRTPVDAGEVDEVVG